MYFKSLVSYLNARQPNLLKIIYFNQFLHVPAATHGGHIVSTVVFFLFIYLLRMERSFINQPGSKFSLTEVWSNIRPRPSHTTMRPSVLPKAAK